ncbi:MAG TPA: hypothetical protein DCQ98_21510 [Planctomycetaceae bacterium]|nr:hypothetical protein [Planctomycetaceae bacterium]HRF02164.1 hypothetical protein [Pirellulaceae bacterium]
MIKRQAQAEKQVKRTGITLVETLAALTLTVILLAGVMVATTMFAADLKRLPRPERRGPSAACRELLQDDYLATRGIDVRPDGYVLQGYSGRDETTGLPTTEISAVEYRRIGSDEGDMVVRILYRRTADRIEVVDRRLLVDDVESFELVVPISDVATWRSLVDHRRPVEGLLPPAVARWRIGRRGRADWNVTLVRPGGDL